MRLAVRNEQLRYQFQLTRSITDNIAEGLILADAEDRIIFTNPACAELLGVEESRLAERLMPLLPDIEALFISGYTEDEAARQGVVEGEGRHFLRKPFQPGELLAKVRSLLDRRKPA